MKSCKIVGTVYNPSKAVKEGWPWPYHSQKLNSPKLYIQMIEKLVEIEKEFDPGMEVDTYFIVFKDTFDLWKEWEKYDNTPKNKGTIHIIFEEKDGGVYLMYNRGFQELKKDYEWFIFTCDDIVVFGDQYYKKILDKWIDGCGYIALQGISTLEEFDHHVQGSIGLTHRDILNKVCEINNGELPHAKGDWKQEAEIHQGEIPFTHKILDLGYHFIRYNDVDTWDKKNLCFPYYNLVN